MFNSFGIFYKDIIPGFRNVWLKLLYNGDISTGFALKYLNIFEVLLDSGMSFFGGNNYPIYIFY